MNRQATIDFVKFVALLALCYGIALGYMYILFEYASNTQQTIMAAFVYYLWATLAERQYK